MLGAVVLPKACAAVDGTVIVTFAKTDLAAMRRALISGANPEGGWGYYPGHTSRLEPTCWALLALASEPDAHLDLSVQRKFFESAQAEKGLLLERALREEDRPNLGFNGLAALLLLSRRELADDAFRQSLVAGIIAHKGIKGPQSSFSPQNNALQGWAWIDSTFSWVEPTCWCLLALKKASLGQREALARIDEAERLLRDRCCAAGGWNAGTANVMGQALLPYVPTTALGLIALQDRQNDPVVLKSAEYLRRERLSERSAMALSLTLVAASILGFETDELRQALITQWYRTNFLGNIHLTAMVLYSLNGEDHGCAAFRI